MNLTRFETLTNGHSMKNLLSQSDNMNIKLCTFKTLYGLSSEEGYSTENYEHPHITARRNVWNRPSRRRANWQLPNYRTWVKSVIAPILFILYFDVMLKEAIQNCAEGIYIRLRTDGCLFDLAQIRARTKTNISPVQELLCDDDCGIFAHSEEDFQLLMDNLVRASKSFGLTVSIQKT